jgi:4-hydroxybenzoate polyprenyltransferase
MSKPWLASVFQAMRPKQWTKNIVVLAAFVFALGDRQQNINIADFWTALKAVLLFCAVSSGVYLMNDVRDVELDRSHPTKKLRPLAAGEISTGTAVGMALVLLAAGLGGAAMLSLPLFSVVAGYVVLQIVYTFALKQIALIDLFVIASGFVLRALAGAVVLNVTISPWLLLCALLLALFLALCKRRHERVVLNDAGGETRENLAQYSEQLLDQLIAVVSAATLVSYALYTLWPDTVAKFGTAKLSLTIPFVIFGLFRYLDLVYRHEKGGQPEVILLTDKPLLVDLALYGLTVAAVLLLKHG